MTIHICQPSCITERHVWYCRTCKQKRRVVVRCYLWYDADAWCTQCGTDPRRPRKYKLTATDGKRADKATTEWHDAPPLAEAKRQFSKMLDLEMQGAME